MIPAVIPVIKQLAELLDKLLNVFHDAGLSWGTSIIALTVLTRALLVPLTYKSLKGMRALQALQPQMKELQEKYKNDRQRLQQEMMNFYRENKVNPAAACIPLLAQAPVFIALYTVLRNDLRIDICGSSAQPCGEGAASWFFIPDLTAKATGSALVILLVLFVSTQLISMAMMSVSVDKSQRMLAFILPAALVPLVFTLPAGLVLYWVTTNLWTIGQQYVVKKVVPPPDIPTSEEKAAAKPPPPPPRKRKKRR